MTSPSVYGGKVASHDAEAVRYALLQRGQQSIELRLVLLFKKNWAAILRIRRSGVGLTRDDVFSWKRLTASLVFHAAGNILLGERYRDTGHSCEEERPLMFEKRRCLMSLI